MKKIVSFILFFLSQLSFAQEQMTLVEDPVFELKEVTVEPSFPGGNDGFYQFIGINFKQPEVPQLIGKVFVSFIVEKDGTLTDIRVIKDVGFGAGAEAERVINSPRDGPRGEKGKPARVLNIVAILFKQNNEVTVSLRYRNYILNHGSLGLVQTHFENYQYWQLELKEPVQFIQKLSPIFKHPKTPGKLHGCSSDDFLHNKSNSSCKYGS